MYLIEFDDNKYLDLEKVMEIELISTHSQSVAMDKVYYWIFDMGDSEDIYESKNFETEKEAVEWLKEIMEGLSACRVNRCIASFVWKNWEKLLNEKIQ